MNKININIVRTMSLAPARFGYVPISHGFQSHGNEWSVDRLLKTNGIIAIIIGSLVFLSVYAWVDAFNQLYREHVSDPPIHHLKQTDAMAPTLNAKWKFIYAVLLTIATIFTAYILLVIWKRFEHSSRH